MQAGQSERALSRVISQEIGANATANQNIFFVGSGTNPLCRAHELRLFRDWEADPANRIITSYHWYASPVLTVQALCVLASRSKLQRSTRSRVGRFTMLVFSYAVA